MDHQIIAEMISWFDLVAIQETNDDLTGLEEVLTLEFLEQADWAGAMANGAVLGDWQRSETDR